MHPGNWTNVPVSVTGHAAPKVAVTEPFASVTVVASVGSPVTAVSLDIFDPVTVTCVSSAAHFSLIHCPLTVIPDPTSRILT